MKYAVLLAAASIGASIGFAQPQPDATALLKGVSEKAETVENWRIEGVTSGSGSAEKSTFSLLRKSASQSRFEYKGGPTPGIVVCDGTAMWAYSTPLNRYSRTPLTDSSACAPILDTWKRLPQTLHSPQLGGIGTYTTQGQSHECQLVHGSYPSAIPTGGTLVKTLCIDSERHIVIWEKIESQWNSQTTIYSRMDTAASFSPDAFAFEPPADSIQTTLRLPVRHELGAPDPLQEDGVTRPALAAKKEPEYDEASRRARVQGTVTLYVVVDVTGHPSDVAVFRSLNPGMDANAIKAVRQWRFVPAQKGGQPEEAVILVEVNFALAR